MAKETPFELAKKEVYAGNLKAPSVSAGTERGIIQVPYFRYQLACHKMAISLLTKGIKLTRNAPPLKTISLGTALSTGLALKPLYNSFCASRGVKG